MAYAATLAIKFGWREYSELFLLFQRCWCQATPKNSKGIFSFISLSFDYNSLTSLLFHSLSLSFFSRLLSLHLHHCKFHFVFYGSICSLLVFSLARSCTNTLSHNPCHQCSTVILHRETLGFSPPPRFPKTIYCLSLLLSPPGLHSR